MTRVSLLGSIEFVRLGPPGWRSWLQVASLDLAFTYKFGENTRLTFGGTNLLDKFPTRQNADETDNGFRYEAVRFGLNGTAHFVRLAHSF